jgi:NADP-dependent 3-hydroxy acid dehydrogenase YdfG
VSAFGLPGDGGRRGFTRASRPGDVAKNIHDFYERFALPAQSFAKMVAFAIGQPEEVDVNEILFRPTRQEL